MISWLSQRFFSASRPGFRYMEDVPTVAFAEETMGDLPAAATPYFLGSLSSGLHAISGIVGFNDTEDAVSFVVPEGLVLSSLPLVTYEDPDTGADGNLGFLFLSEGLASFTPTPTNLQNILGGIVTVTSEIGDLLPKLANATLDPDALSQDPVPPLGQGFEVPLMPGNYSLVVTNPGDNGTAGADLPVLYEVHIGLSDA